VVKAASGGWGVEVSAEQIYLSLCCQGQICNPCGASLLIPSPVSVISKRFFSLLYLLLMRIMAAAARAFQLACRARCTSPAINPATLRPVGSAAHQSYATQSSLGRSTTTSTNARRKAVTVTTDDGRYRWSDLTTREKAARSTQQSFNLALVAAGAVGTVRHY
jgi:hypothetical protein